MLEMSLWGLDFTVYEMLLYFVFYSVLGWLVEVCYMTVQEGEFQNRGFLNGPICPIYGFGVLLVIIALTPLKNNIIMLFICSFFLCTALELVVGIGLKKIFHNTWWDYSNEKFNFMGLICLKTSICWGGACVIMLKILQPFLANFVKIIPTLAVEIFLIITFFLIFLDAVVSFCTVNNLNKRLKQIDDISQKLRISSDAIGGNLSKEVLELKEKYNKLIAQKRFAQERLVKAFPMMKSDRYSHALEEIKKKIWRRRS
ncbi:MAG: putative ABC transporter permease [Oscillospiraceae bacterium]